MNREYCFSRKRMLVQCTFLVETVVCKLFVSLIVFFIVCFQMNLGRQDYHVLTKLFQENMKEAESVILEGTNTSSIV